MSDSETRDERLARRVQEVLDLSKNCAQTAFAVLQEEFDLEGEAILRALTPMPGLALRGETCGAVTGCLMAIGLVYGRDDLGDWKGYLASLPPSRRFCKKFEKAYGSMACGDLLESRMGHRYDLSNSVDALRYAAAGGKRVCGELITGAVQTTAGIIARKVDARK